MASPKIPDWAIFGGVVAVLSGAVVLMWPRRPPPPAPEAAGAPIAAASPFDPTLAAAPLPTSGSGSGTAFSIDQKGVWLTARHVVEGCGKLAIVVGPGSGVEARARIDPLGETAILTTHGGAPPLAFAAAPALRAGTIAYHPGFPQGRPGEVASRLIGRARLVVRGRDRRPEPVLAWAETARTPGLSYRLAGLSGAPALDETGRVIGVTLAQAPRRGRLFTTDPLGLRLSLARFGVSVSSAARADPISRAAYLQAGDDLRRSLRVVQVVCLVK